MLSLGSFQFSVSSAAYAKLVLTASYPWVSVDRLENTPQHQAMGKESRSISLDGVVYPAYRGAGTRQIETLRSNAAKMEPQVLVAGDGRMLGKWVVKKIGETGSDFFSDGTPRKQEFSLEMERFD